MKIQIRMLLIFIVFLGIMILNNSNCFASWENTKEDIPKDIPFYDTFYPKLPEGSYHYIIVKRKANDNLTVHTRVDHDVVYIYYYNYNDINHRLTHWALDGSRASESFPTYLGTLRLLSDSYDVDFHNRYDFSYLTGFSVNLSTNTLKQLGSGAYTLAFDSTCDTVLFSTDDIYVYAKEPYYTYNIEDMSTLDRELYHEGFNSNTSDKLNLFELNLTDLDYNNQVHQFNICTYTDSPYYDELMNYYNNDVPYYIYVTDYQRILTYGKENDDSSFQYGSYGLSGYIDFLTHENAFAYYSPVTNEVRYSKNAMTLSIYSHEKQKYSDISKIAKRFYFELTYSEDSNDPNAIIWTDNGTLKEFYETNQEPEWEYFIGGSGNIRYAKSKTMLGLNTPYVLTNQFYYVGYLGEDGKRKVDDIPFYRYDFDFAGGTTKLFFLNSATYTNDILNAYQDWNNEYNNNELIQDTSEGTSYKQGHDYATSTFQPGQVTEDTTPEEDKQHFGQIETVNNSSIDITRDWTILDFLRGIYNTLTGQGNDGSSAANSINNTTNTIKNKFSFSNNIINNANEIKDYIVNTQETHKYYLNINHKYLNGQVCIIDLSWYEPYKPTVDAFICAFAYLAFIWHMFCNIPSLIRGSSAGSYISDIQAYKETGFGRSSNIHKGGF